MAPGSDPEINLTCLSLGRWKIFVRMNGMSQVTFWLAGLRKSVESVDGCRCRVGVVVGTWIQLFEFFVELDSSIDTIARANLYTDSMSYNPPLSPSGSLKTLRKGTDTDTPNSPSLSIPVPPSPISMYHQYWKPVDTSRVDPSSQVRS